MNRTGDIHAIATEDAVSGAVPVPASARREVHVPDSLDGARLDKALTELVPELSRARVKRAIELGAVRVNGKRVPKG
ncbi:MAG TPA: S4 domain-containing protein, partial [Polyangiaceae bacterium]